MQNNLYTESNVNTSTLILNDCSIIKHFGKLIINSLVIQYNKAVHYKSVSFYSAELNVNTWQLSSRYQLFLVKLLQWSTLISLSARIQNHILWSSSVRVNRVISDTVDQLLIHFVSQSSESTLFVPVIFKNISQSSESYLML
jgi:hypothetical protein